MKKKLTPLQKLEAAYDKLQEIITEKEKDLENLCLVRDNMREVCEIAQEAETKS